MEIQKDQGQAEGIMVFVCVGDSDRVAKVAHIYPILVRNQFGRYLQIIWVYHFQRSIVVNHDNTDFASEQSKL